MATELETLRRQVQWLMDKEAIRSVKLRYCRFSDNGRFDDFATLFTDDYRTEIHGPPSADGVIPQTRQFHSAAAWVAFARERDGAWSANAAHHIHGGEIEPTGPDTARAIWPSQFDGLNGYHDEEYRRVDGVWKISRGRFFAQARRVYQLDDTPVPPGSLA